MKKILIIRFSSIGDIVLTTPVVRCLKQVKDRQYEVHYTTKEVHAGLLNNNPYIDMVHLLDKRGLWNLAKRLRRERFDFVIDLHNNQRSLLLKTILGVSSSSFNKLNFSKWLLVHFRKNLLPDLHIVDRYMATAARLGVVNDNNGLDYFIPDKARQLPEGIPLAYRNGFIAFSIGGKHHTKRLPNEKIIEICDNLSLPVILLGGMEDAANGKVISQACSSKAEPFNACGMLSLDQSAYVLQMASTVITHDTGLMHIAAALNKPIVSIWGNTIPEFGMYPYVPQHQALSKIVEIDQLPCRPCSKIGFDKCPKGHFDCMNRIDGAKVAQLASGEQLSAGHG